jgi:hypothetical protein
MAHVPYVVRQVEVLKLMLRARIRRWMKAAGTHLMASFNGTTRGNKTSRIRLLRYIGLRNRASSLQFAVRYEAYEKDWRSGFNELPYVDHWIMDTIRFRVFRYINWKWRHYRTTYSIQIMRTQCADAAKNGATPAAPPLPWPKRNTAAASNFAPRGSFEPFFARSAAPLGRFYTIRFIFRLPPDNLLLDRSPNIGPIISCWELDKFKSCRNKSLEPLKSWHFCINNIRTCFNFTTSYEGSKIRGTVQ